MLLLLLLQILSFLILLGYIFQARCLVVTHCCRQSDSVIRLISARPATAQEEEVDWETQMKKVRFLAIP